MTTSKIAVIGGTGMNQLSAFSQTERHELETPFGLPSGTISSGRYFGQEVCFLARHGQPHCIPPHKINYRANLWALKSLGISDVVAVNAVGGIHSHLPPSAVAVPDQIIDYTCGREHTIYDGTNAQLEHVDFTEPYCQSLRLRLIEAAQEAGIETLPCGTYAATNGPRLESAAEVLRIKQDGGDMIGMTGMPEASLARELGLNYACLAVSVNWGAGLHGLAPITMKQIQDALVIGMGAVEKILDKVLNPN